MQRRANESGVFIGGTVDDELDQLILISELQKVVEQNLEIDLVIIKKGGKLDFGNMHPQGQENPRQEGSEVLLGEEEVPTHFLYTEKGQALLGLRIAGL